MVASALKYFSRRWATSLPEPGTPGIKEIDGKKVFQVRELVRINHHRNCLLCHAPGNTANVPDKAIKAGILVPGDPFPSHSGYQDRPSHPDLVVRIDVTYLRQDFSRRNAEEPALLSQTAFVVALGEVECD